MSVTRSLVENLITRRDELESRRGPNNDFDAHIRKRLIDLFIHANRHGDIPTVNWCHEQLANERRRTELNSESLIPSGIVNPERSTDYFQGYGFYDSFRPRGRRHHEDNAEHESEMMPMLNPFNSRPSLQQEFVPPPALAAAAAEAAAAPNPNANRRCNNCNQLGHVRSECPNHHVPGRRGPVSRGHGKRGGKTRRHHNKNGKKSIRRGKH